MACILLSSFSFLNKISLGLNAKGPTIFSLFFGIAENRTLVTAERRSGPGRDLSLDFSA